MVKKTMWYGLLFISLIVSLILLTGFISTLAITTTSKKAATTAPIPPKIVKLDPNYYNILVMGDSLAKGTGDERGKGFAGYFADSYKSKTPKEIKVNNIAVNGDVSSGLLKIIQTEQTLNYIKTSSIIFISIGGNEISQFKNKDVSLSNPEVKNTEDTYLKNLKEIYKAIRTTNNSCIIIFLGLYNPFGTVITPDQLKMLNEWNFQTQQLSSEDINSIFIPTYDLFQYNLANYLTVDNFHPNSTGYKAISNRMIESLKNFK